jgi:hypothetical protein
MNLSQCCRRHSLMDSLFRELNQHPKNFILRKAELSQNSNSRCVYHGQVWVNMRHAQTIMSYCLQLKSLPSGWGIVTIAIDLSTCRGRISVFERFAAPEIVHEKSRNLIC